MGALDGILVVALEQAVAAPICTARLVEAGARVIKVERPEGETARHYDTSVKGVSAYFAWLNAGKESVVLDLKSPDEMALFRQVLARADVLVQNLVPGATARLGLSDAAIRRDFPRLISVSISGYGQDTPYADMRAYDMLVQAEAGLCAVTGTGEVPSKVGVSVADIATGGNAHAAILEALILRGRTGVGQCIEIAMFDSIADWMSVPLLHLEYGGRQTTRHGLSHASIYPYRPFEGADGVLIVAAQNDAKWGRLCELVLRCPEFAKDPALATNALRVKNRDRIDALLEPEFAALSMREARRCCDDGGIAWAVYRDVAGLSEHPALRRRTVTLADGQEVSLPQPAGRTVPGAPGPVPGLGAHTDEMRREFGGAATPTNEDG